MNKKHMIYNNKQQPHTIIRPVDVHIKFSLKGPNPSDLYKADWSFSNINIDYYLENYNR